MTPAKLDPQGPFKRDPLAPHQMQDRREFNRGSQGDLSIKLPVNPDDLQKLVGSNQPGDEPSN